MRRSEDRILTTHTGSLPRPDDLVALLYARDAGEPVDEADFRARVRDAVAGIVRQQAAAGIAVVNDGEQSKVGYSTYVKERLTGFGDEMGRALAPADLTDFPEFAARRTGMAFARPACTGPIAYRGLDAVQEDVADFRAALEGVDAADAFLTAASPGVISLFLENRHYPDHEAYLFALADAMKVEYDAIHQAGFVLQVDCPDLAMGRHIQFADLSLADFRRNAELHVAALNRALVDIPPDRLRMHLCWGNYEGPHHRDVALRDIIDIVFTARPSAISFEAANPRHEHEWAVFEDVALPEGKICL